MTKPLIIGISGLRGIIGAELTPRAALDYGCAFGTYLKSIATDKARRLHICIGCDSRTSSPMLKSSIVSGLTAAGIDVTELGIVSTPGVGIMVKHLNCDGGVIITASHNPIRYNGIKLLTDKGTAPPVQTAGKIKQYFINKKFHLADSSHCGRISFENRTDDVHIARVLKLVDTEKIAAKSFKVAIDSVNGAGGRVTKKLLHRLGCNTIAINDEPTGLFAHEPEPAARNLTELCGVVKDEGADIGFAQDPDADRLAIVSAKGVAAGEEYTLAFAVRSVLSKRPGAVATNLSTSRMIDDIAEKAGCSVIRTPVGEANVVSAMLENNCVIGGEGNGGVIDLRVVPIRDSLVAIALTLQLMAESGKSIEKLTEESGNYHMRKEKFPADKQQAAKILEAAGKTFCNAKVNTSDGCRFDFEKAWLHLRTSNTEPVMRMIIEAEDKQTAQKYAEAVSKIRQNIQAGQ